MAVSLSLIGAFKGLSLSSNSSSSFLRGDLACLPVAPKFSISFPLRSPLTIESALKKGAGSTKNGRDSPGQRLGVKISVDQVSKPGSIIVRQRGTKFHPGKNVGLGKDHTIFSLIDGLVKFEKFGPDRKKISVYPREVQPENPNSYRNRKRESPSDYSVNVERHEERASFFSLSWYLLLLLNPLRIITVPLADIGLSVFKHSVVILVITSSDLGTYAGYSEHCDSVIDVFCL
ncbi:hypothetical protein RND71_038869 [Anisodus tanguticus]|uniref:Large ribosomal subunit protein bL27c n=1 Tax=Anisodus tanguticus TaxID=243964 RepID=A0AAE1R1B2_9SOLA|nr:hypothetical protein RND71_038869 [Anisodus tanguticus]